MEEQPGLHPRQWIEVLQLRIPALCQPWCTGGCLCHQSIEILLRQREQREVLWNQGTAIRLQSLSHQLPQADQRALSQLLHALNVGLLITEVQPEMHLLVHNGCHHIKLMRSRVLWSMLPTRVFRSQGEE